MKNTESLDYIYYFFKMTTERHLIMGAAKLNQHIYFKGILTSKFGSKDMLL